MCGIWGQIVNDIPQQLSSYVAINTKQAYEACKTVQKRGPERTTIKETSNYFLAFHRLAINGVDESNDQPYVHIVPPSDNTHKAIIMCNGEIYNFHELNKELGTSCKCDTQIIWELYKDCEFNFHTLNQRLKGEYALMILIIDVQTSKPYRAYFSVDPCSVRPLFYHIDHPTTVSPLSVTFSSLLSGVKHTKNPQRLHGGQMLTVDFHTNQIHASYYWNWDATPPVEEQQIDIQDIQFRVVSTLEACVKRRLSSDREIGCFLSGGLDSSIIAAIVAQNLAKIGKRLRTFSIGAPDSQDVKHAEIVAKHINSIHVNVPFRVDEGLACLHEVIEATETFDITTIRASVGQFLISKYIREHTDIKVVFSGDGADEAEMGYLYFYNAPSDEAAQQESVKLLQEIHLYDGLRVDRCVSWHGLEARVPYLDEDFVSFMISIPAHFKRPIRPFNRTSERKEEKALLRHAFAKFRPTLLPSSVLFRTKETFSDSLSTETSDWYANLKIFTLQGMKLLGSRSNISYLPPPSPEAAYYRYIFRELFGEHCTQVIPHLWMPLWVKHTNGDPSAKQMDVYDIRNNCETV